jgi:hypothetical protein
MSDHPKPAGAPLVKDASSRLHQCFPLAVMCLQKDPSWSMVHGVVYGGVAHAWLRKGEWIYDPVKDISMSVGEYERTHQAKAERSYTALEATSMSSRTGHWGPWHPESAAMRISEILREFAESTRSVEGTSGTDVREERST